MRGAETMAARGYLGNAPPPRIRFFNNSKKSDGRNMLQTHINTVEARTFPTVHAAIHRAR